MLQDTDRHANWDVLLMGHEHQRQTRIGVGLEHTHVHIEIQQGHSQKTTIMLSAGKKGTETN